MFDFADNYINELMKNDKFNDFLAIKKEIDKKYASLIIKFKNKEALYLEAKERPNVYNLEKAQLEYVEAKKELYSKAEVVRYFELEREIQNMLNDDLNEIKENISNKFIKDKNTFF